MVTEGTIDLSRFLDKMNAAASTGTKEERIQIPLVLENVLRYCLKDAQERMEKGEELVPFSALAVGETLFMEEHPGDTAEECFAGAKQTVEHASGAAAYGFCYDGFIEMGEKHTQHDCIIAEGGCPGEPYGHAIGVPYRVKEDGTFDFADEPIYVGNAMNYMLSLDYLTSDDEDEAKDEGAAEGKTENE